MSIFRNGSATKFVLDGDKVREGDSWGAVKYTLDGDRIRAGDSCWGSTVAYMSSDGVIRKGNGSAIANVDDEGYVRAGAGSWGRIIGRIEK